MSRKLDLSKPLSAADIKRLRATRPEPFVQRMIELAGGASEAPDAPEKEEEAEEPQGTPDDSNAPENAGEGPDEGVEEDEDLIGNAETDFDPSKHTVDEVVKHLKQSDDAEQSRVLAAEATGKGRSGILNA